MPPQSVIQGLPSRRNVNPQGPEVSNALEVQPPQREVTNAEFRDAIRMLSQVVANQAGKKRVKRSPRPAQSSASTPIP
ncbi:hypothetical protein H5410_060819 [Solanum commersonii]|uniref:Gag-pol polyprotein n=1 Tax=Solanum commersonii TaxID=4109 RepID=A0A9J5W632_SOLCO|nr:hypothetical protein H5410_060819 [Solanum commersonii]